MFCPWPDVMGIGWYWPLNSYRPSYLLSHHFYHSWALPLLRRECPPHLRLHPQALRGYRYGTKVKAFYAISLMGLLLFCSLYWNIFADKNDATNASCASSTSISVAARSVKWIVLLESPLRCFHNSKLRLIPALSRGFLQERTEHRGVEQLMHLLWGFFVVSTRSLGFKKAFDRLLRRMDAIDDWWRPYFFWPMYRISVWLPTLFASSWCLSDVQMDANRVSTYWWKFNVLLPFIYAWSPILYR